MTTFTEDLAAALRAKGWEIHHMTDYGFEWWWIPEKHTNYWQTKTPDESRDWYMTLQDAVGQALLTDTRAAKADPLIPRGTGKIICDEKHGEFEYDSALEVVRSRLSDDYWYENWTDPIDNPDGVLALMWKDRAELIVAQEDEAAALAFLIERRGFEYERFYFEHPEPSEATA